MSTRLIALIRRKNNNDKLDKVLENNLKLRIATLEERIIETEKITTNETPKSMPEMLFQILENQEHIMNSLINIQKKLL